jgi:Putative zinc-finger
MKTMDCRRAEELLSDYQEDALDAVLRAELEDHLAGCGRCRELSEALVVVKEALRAFPDLDAPAGLAERAAAAARKVPRVPVVRPALVVPHWMSTAAAGFALIALGSLLMILGPDASTRAAERLVGRTVDASQVILERKDRLVEDVRILGVVLGTAFEGRLERVNERVEDYRKLLERRRETAPEDSKRRSETRSRPVQLAAAFRTGKGAGS